LKAFCVADHTSAQKILRVSVSFLLILALMDMFLHGVFVVRGQDYASWSVEEADLAVRQAFNATLDAERAGANVSDLILKLNEAGNALVEAEDSLKAGNSSAAINNASLCVGIADEVNSNAATLKVSASAEARTVSWEILTFSLVSIVVFCVALVLVWGWFKRRVAKRTLSMKPEVASDEA
jgi:hypothetical protein